MTKTALITGITGQDGSYLTELLLSKGYEVHGLIRRVSTFNAERLETVYADPGGTHSRLHLRYGDLSDGSGLTNMIREIRPDEVYHLGAQSHVRVSFDAPEYTGDITALGTVRLLDAIRHSGVDTRFYQASSSEMYGSTPPPQGLATPFHPRSPYAVAKVYGFWAAVNYRESYGMFAVNGILFNHESPRRGETFVTRKITRAVARIHAGLQTELKLGNLTAVRDWGYAPEYVEGMWRMLQHDVPQDYVLGTGVAASVRDFCEASFARVGLEYRDYVGQDARHERPAEVDALVADASLAHEVLGWRARTDWKALAALMVDADVASLDDELAGRTVRIDR